MNKVILIGRLSKDPETRFTAQGTAVTNFTVAVDRPFTNHDGKREADFIDCQAWRKLGETIGNHMKKGRLIAVEGRLELSSYDDNQGIRRRAARVVCDDVRFLDSPMKDPGGDAEGALVGAGVGASTGAADFPDDLPF